MIHALFFLYYTYTLHKLYHIHNAKYTCHTLDYVILYMSCHVSGMLYCRKYALSYIVCIYDIQERIWPG